MIQVKKLDGTLQEYDEDKLRRSLKDAGAKDHEIEKVLDKVDKILFDGIETKKLFKFVLREYRKLEPYKSSVYNLKNGLLRLGKGGFAFEEFVAKIFKEKGYKVVQNQEVKGKYIYHEIDIVAQRDNNKMMIECKHRIKPWLGINIKTALYVYARFLDVKSSINIPCLATNAKFSKQVLKYSKGVGLRLMGWKYPKNDSLEYNIEKYKLYPVTMLSSVNTKFLPQFLRHKILLVKEIADMSEEDIQKVLGVKGNVAGEILKEARALCKNNSVEV